MVLGDATQLLQGRFTLEIKQYKYDIVVECQDDIVSPGNSVSANITITNNGLYEGDVQITWWTEDGYGVNYTSGSTIANISSGVVWESTKSLLVPTTAEDGIYYFKVRVSVETYSETVYDTFEVIKPVTPSVPGGAGGAPPEAVPGVPEIEKPEIDVEVLYKKNYPVIMGTSKTYEIVVKNKGNVDLHDLTIYLQGLKLSWYSITKRVDLKAGESVSFEVEFTVPVMAEIKRYPIKFLVRSKEFEKNFYSTLSVIKVLRGTEFEEMKKQLIERIELVENKLRGLEREMINVTAISKLLDRAREKLYLAAIGVERGDLEEGSELVYEVEDVVIMIEETLKTIEPEGVRRLWSIVLIVLVAAIFILLSVATRRIKRKRFKIFSM